MTSYLPALDPEPIVDWGPGSARHYKHEEWDHADVALQFEYFGKTGNGDTVATLSLHATQALRGTPSISIELTHGDIIELLSELMQAHHEEYHAKQGDVG